MNESGIKPVEYKVLVKPKKVEEKTAGGIYLPDETREKEQFGMHEGELIAVSPMAFTDPKWLDCPQVGETVVYGRYAGRQLVGEDGEKYRLMDDKEIGGVRYER